MDILTSNCPTKSRAGDTNKVDNFKACTSCAPGSSVEKGMDLMSLARPMANLFTSASRKQFKTTF
jgi:hypothetical protein